jgi:hypothetical protein
MRKLRVIFAAVGTAGPALVATFVDGCGSPEDGGGTPVEAAVVDSPQSFSDSVWLPSPYDAAPRRCDESFVVELPPPGTPAEPGQICAVASPVSSNVAARVTLTEFEGTTAVGAIAVPDAVAAQVVGLPSIVITDATDERLLAPTIEELDKTPGGYRFRIRWAKDVSPWFCTHAVVQMTVKTTFVLSCDDAATRTVEALTKINQCRDPDERGVWVSSGDVCCTVCTIIAEMAPSPIVSDKIADDLPLARVIRLRVVEVARRGRHALLFAESDGGADVAYEWRVSGGSIERISNDVVLWTLPDEPGAFGQVAAWNETGAAVENFMSGAIWEAA